MPLLNYAPTKTNMIRLKNDLKFAQQGHSVPLGLCTGHTEKHD